MNCHHASNRSQPWSIARATRRRPARLRRSPSSIERLEPRTPLAADLAHASSVRRIDWEGGLVDARADGWIVQSAGDAAPQIRSGWRSQSLGEGFFSITAPGASVADVRGWATTAGIRGLEPDRMITAAALPNDPSFSRLYGLHNTGQTGGLADADIDAAEAWDVTTGSRSVVVSVIDTGVDYRHPDLAANVWTNPREVAGDRIDNDGNGYVDDVYGWDFANNDADPFDDEGHGTHVAGTIGAVGNNGTGVTGVNWQVSIMALKFLDANGSGTTSAAIAAINYATKMRRDFGVNIVATNNSWGGGGFSSSLQNAINAGGSAGILFVAAAGNEGVNNDTTPSYPASYSSGSIIAVAATDSSNRLASFSNYGATSVDVAAPGVGILSTTPNNTYASYSGTSMATPQVTGVVALLKAARPDATADQIRAAILSTTTPVAGLAGKVATGGVVNAAAALAALVGTPPAPPPPTSGGPYEANDSIATASAVTLAGGRASVSAVVGDGAYGASDVDLFAVTVPAGGTLTVDIDAQSLGSALDSYLRVFNAAGTQLAANDDAGSLDSLVSFTAQAAGTYYVGVSAYGNSTYSASAAGSGAAGTTTGGYTAAFTVALPAPTADVVDVSPDPRTTSVGAVLVVFDRAVTGFDAADLTLMRSGASVPLTGVTVTTADNVRWTVNGLDAATASAGAYTLTLNAAGSGITSADGVALAAAASDTWTTQAATLVDAGDSLATAAVIGITSGEIRLAGVVGDGAFGSRDVDLYRVTLVAGQTIVVDIDAVTLAGGSSLDSYVRLFDSRGRQVAANDDSGGTFDSYLSRKVTASGTYYVGVSGFGNRSYSAATAGSGSAGSTGVYQLRLAFSSVAAGTVDAARIAGAVDRPTPASGTALSSAFAMYGVNWSAALPATALPIADRPRRSGR
jgi:subtilisin family serine protease